jgi:nucleoside-triphosphatase THEP1
MSKPPFKLFLTGDPGCGKTTVIRRVVERLQGGVAMNGFVTEEVLERGRRHGFRGVTLKGRSFPLASRDADSEMRVGPYGVSLAGLETVGLDALRPDPGTELFVLDEVGKMEAFSEKFRERVLELIEGPTPLLATVAAHGVGYVKRVRRDPRITLVRMRRKGRDAMVGDILRRLSAAGIRPRSRKQDSDQSGS